VNLEGFKIEIVDNLKPQKTTILLEIPKFALLEKKNSNILKNQVSLFHQK